MKYKTFNINVSERKPGKWCAQITRAVGKRFKQFATGVDRSSAVEAMTKAMETIDAIAISPNIERTTEKYWRCLSKADRKPEAVTSGEIRST